MEMRLLILLAVICVVHVFAHSRAKEPPHLKYSREVNEAAQKGIHEEDDHLHGHGHSHGPGGGCSHGHSHEEPAHGEDHHHGHSHGEKPSIAKKTGHQRHSQATNGKQKEFTFDKNGMFSFLNDARTRLWVYSIGSTILISACPCLILAFIPIQANTDENSPLLKLLLAFGAGGLLGDAFLHLIPHATPPGPPEGHAHSHSHGGGGGGGHSHAPHDMSVGQWVLTGFMVFFIVEKFVRILRGDDSAGHSHSHAAAPQKSSKAKVSDASDDTADSEPSPDHDRTKKPAKSSKASAAKADSKSDVMAEVPRIRVAAYLNLVADFMHNFTDGLAIGASFIAGSTIGVVTMVTVLVHEVPHEIGDFAILIRSGYSKGKAMLIQLCTAGGALAGCVISLWSVDAYAMAEAAEQSWVLPFTAGGFIYIATVSVIPELLERSTFWQSVRETLAILFGVFLMYLIAFYE